MKFQLLLTLVVAIPFSDCIPIPSTSFDLPAPCIPKEPIITNTNSTFHGNSTIHTNSTTDSGNATRNNSEMQSSITSVGFSSETSSDSSTPPQENNQSGNLGKF
jgi:hypothetical protein